MNLLVRIVTGTLIIAIIVTVLWSRFGEQDFGSAATRVALKYEMGEKCPLSYASLKSEDVGLISICSTFGLKSYLAARENREVAGTLFATYGKEDDFLLVVDKYGAEALATIQYFRDRDSLEFRIRARRDQLWKRFRSGEPLDVPPVKLTPDEHGFIAIQELKRRGHNLLAEFEFSDGVKRKQVKRLISAATELFTSGVTDLEARILRGEKITWRHVAYAVLDVSVIVGGAASVAKVLQGAKVAGKATMLAKTSGAFSTARTVIKSVAVVGAVSVAAIVAYNPSLMISAAGWVAQQVGLPAWAGVAFLAGIVAFALMSLLEVAYRIVLRLTWPVRKVIRIGTWMHAAYLRRRARRIALRSQN